MTGFDEAVGRHEDSNQQQQKNRIGGVGSSEFGRHGIPLGFDDQPAGSRDNDCEKYDCGGVVAKRLVDLAGYAGDPRFGQADGSTHGDQRERADYQNQKAAKQKDMDNARGRVARMSPLTQPELQHLTRLRPRPVESRIACAPQKGRQAFGRDVKEANGAQDVDDQKESTARYAPPGCFGG